MRTCTKCGTEKADTEFYKDKKGPRGRTHQCKQCYRDYNVEFDKKNPGRRRGQRAEWWRQYGYKYSNGAYCRRSNLKRFYKMTLEDYDRMHKVQDGRCAICRRPETYKRLGKVMNLSVDHNHITGEVRGLLCHACNRGVGLLRDSADTLLAAAAYVRRHSHIRLAKEA